MLCACHELNASSKHKDSMIHVKVYRDTHCDAVCLQRTHYVIDISRTQWVMSQSTYFDPVHLSRTQYVIEISQTQWVMSLSTVTHTSMLCICHELNESCHSLPCQMQRYCMPVSIRHQNVTNSMSHVELHMYINICVYIYVYMHIYIYIYIYI